ncbi:CDP-alcohol phosphatidyltransferase family protein [Polaribacter sp.]|uniref:CDP-alcohol phosphatidyltransferase family protein n=1 Tax=Polaribacter sp. TaxID=1920175 RepID=UPI0025EB6E10|nr:CDP-alcohol phosphatidyltransferase family protein [Polaribacter sp.]
MKLKKQIPNLVTLGNLFCGVLATIYAASDDFEATAVCVVIGIGLDFFDGFIARLLKVTGELGKQLDSLADMVTSGVVPGIVMFKLLNSNLVVISDNNNFLLNGSLLGLILTLGACYRLAKFNLDTRQTNSFIGLPTPAMCLFVISLPLIQTNTNITFVQILLLNPYFLVFIILLLTFLMNAEISLFSLKFKEYSLSHNYGKYLFLLASILMILFLNYISIPLIIILYVIVSITLNHKKSNSVNNN